MKISEVAVDRVHDALALADVILAEIDEDSDKCTPPMSHEAWVRNRIGIAKMLIDAEAQP